MRTLKIGLEHRTGDRVGADSQVLPWIAQHAAALINRYHKGSDGATAYKRARGRDHLGDMCEIGESVLYLKPGSGGKYNMDSRWGDGIWLGVVDSSGEKVIATPQGCLKVRAAQRKP